MKEEYPSTEEEPFEVPLEGTYFGKEMARVRKEGRIQRLPWMPMPVNSFWDLGHSDYTSIWLHQHVWPWNHFLRYYQNSGEKVAHYAGWLQRELADRGAVMGTIYLPMTMPPRITPRRRTATRSRSASSSRAPTSSSSSGRTTSITTASSMTRQVLPTCRFDPEGCDDGIKAMDSYRKQWNDLLGVWRIRAATRLGVARRRRLRAVRPRASSPARRRATSAAPAAEELQNGLRRTPCKSA
jgi:hypothetical protein